MIGVAVVGVFRLVFLTLLITFSSKSLSYVDLPKAKQKVHFDIYQKTAEMSLIEFAEQADLDFIFRYQEVEGKITNRLIGLYTVQEAIEIMLLNSSLTSSINDKGQLTISLNNEQSVTNLSKDNKTAVNDFEEPSEADSAEKIIVTGTYSGRAIAKEKASFAISSFDAESIKKLGPKSTADLFKAIPGVWSESSGGVAGANVFVRGFPGGGDAPFLTVHLQGAPIFQPPTLSFLENSTLFRIDETVEFMEALRGGPNPVISNGQPGLTTNFILKEGSERTEGLVKYSTSDYGLKRVDVLMSGSLADDLYYMMGGYIKSSPGVRDSGFNGEEGSQFTINITKQLDRGKLNVYTRQTDYYGVWYLPAPLAYEGNDFTQIGSNNRQATISYGTANTTEIFDFGKGRGWDGGVSGGSLELELPNNWSLVDRFNYTKGNANTYGLVPGENAVALASVAINGTSATGLVTGTEYDGSTIVQQYGRWIVKKQIESMVNDFALTKTFDSASFTLGYYSASFSSKDWWALGDYSYHVVEQGGENLDGIDCNQSVDGCAWNYDFESTGDGTTNAFYAAASIDITQDITLDVGLRSESHTIEYVVDEGLDNIITKQASYDESDTAWTVGANWMFSDTMGVFIRANSGGKMPYFDDIRENYQDYIDGQDLIQEISQFEAGYKLVDDNFDIFATFFLNEVKGDATIFIHGTPTTVTDNEAYGLELDFNYYNDEGLSINLNSTLQDIEITGGNPALIGNKTIRQPNYQIRVTPSYQYEFNNIATTVYGTISAVADRYSNPENTVTLDSYQKIDIGLIMGLTDEVEFRLSVANLTNSDGITEGDPRSATSGNGRYILPRTFDVSVSYTF